MAIITQSLIYRTGASIGSAVTRFFLCDTFVELPAAVEGDLAYAKDTDGLYKYTTTWVLVGGGDGTIVIENRTDDPVGPATGRMWLRTDL